MMPKDKHQCVIPVIPPYRHGTYRLGITLFLYTQRAFKFGNIRRQFFFLRRNFGNLCIQHSYTIIDMRDFGRQRFEPVQRLQLRFLRLIYLTVGTLDILQCGRLLFFKDCTFFEF